MVAHVYHRRLYCFSSQHFQTGTAVATHCKIKHLNTGDDVNVIFLCQFALQLGKNEMRNAQNRFYLRKPKMEKSQTCLIGFDNNTVLLLLLKLDFVCMRLLKKRSLLFTQRTEFISFYLYLFILYSITFFTLIFIFSSFLINFHVYYS